MRHITAAMSLERFPEEHRESVAQIREVRSWGYVGHFALLANLIAGLAKHSGTSSFTSAHQRCLHVSFAWCDLT